MNDLDNLMPNENDDTDHEMTDDELALYLEILASAYPKPKTNLKEAVAAKIREEQELSSQSKKKSPIDKKKFTARIVKWGSLAACIAVICLAGVKVIPSLVAKSDDLAASYNAASFDAVGKEDYADYGMTKAMTTSEEIFDATASSETSEETGAPYEAEIRKYDAESYNSLFTDGSSYSMMYSLPRNEAEEEIEEVVTEGTGDETEEDLLKSGLSGEFESDLKQNLIDAVRSAVSEDTLPSPDLPLEEIITTLGISPILFNEILADLTSVYESQYPDAPIPSYNYETITKDTVR